MMTKETIGMTIGNKNNGKSMQTSSASRKELIEGIMSSVKKMDPKFKGPNCQWCPASKTKCYYRELSDDIKPAWIAIRSHIRYQEGHNIFHAGHAPNAVYVVCKGEVGIIRHDENGNELLAHIAEQGEMVGDRAFCAGGKYKESAVLIGKDTIVVAIEGTPFDRLLDIEPHLLRVLLRERSRELASAEKRAVAMAFNGVQDRIEDVLAKKSKNLRFTYPYGLLAAMTGIARETMSRMLNQMESKGLVKREKGAIVLLPEFVQKYNRKMEVLGKTRRIGQNKK